jgi:hypothetical protein
MKCHLRSRFDLLHPEVSKKVESQQVESHDNSRPLRSFKEDEKVYAKNHTSNTPKWIAGTVSKVTGPLSYVIQLEDGRIVRRHVDHVKKRDVFPGVSTDLTPEPPDTTPESSAPPPQDTTDEDTNVSQENEPEHADPSADEPESEIVDSTQPRRSARVHKPPDYFNK